MAFAAMNHKYQNVDYPTLWARLNDGLIPRASLTYNQDGTVTLYADVHWTFLATKDEDRLMTKVCNALTACGLYGEY